MICGNTTLVQVASYLGLAHARTQLFFDSGWLKTLLIEFLLVLATLYHGFIAPRLV